MAKKKTEDEILQPDRPAPSAGGATYVSVTKVIETEENYVVHLCPIYSPAQLEEGLKSGALNLQQSQTVEPYVFVVDAQGQRVATLEKDGGMGPNHNTTIEVR